MLKEKSKGIISEVSLYKLVLNDKEGRILRDIRSTLKEICFYKGVKGWFIGLELKKMSRKR